MQTLLDSPDETVAALVKERPVFGIARAAVCLHDAYGSVIELELAPWVPAAEEGFPNERVRILATSRRSVYVVPQNAQVRRWKHRMPGDLGELCLWYARDEASLVWRWDDGLIDLITIAHRHLHYEEYWRRNGSWPVEDAPHGFGSHPVRTRRVRDAADRWER